jgi:hypothetical protein
LTFYIFAFLIAVFTLVALLFILSRLVVPLWFFFDQKLIYVTPPVVYRIRLSGLGFLVPASLTVGAIILGRHGLRLRSTPWRRFAFLLTALLEITIVSAVLSFILPSSLLFRPAGGTDFVVLIAMLAFQSTLIRNNETQLALRLAFLLGFALGFVSDLESLRFIHPSVFGGYGIFDGDFLGPIAMLVATWAACRFFGTRVVARLSLRVPSSQRP